MAAEGSARVAPAAAPRLIVHAGAHKTATSLVQKFARDKPDALARLGWRFIGRGDCNEYIGWGDALERQASALRERITSELAVDGAHAVLLSHENTLGRPFIPGEPGLYPRAAANLRALAAATGGHGWDTTVVLSIRPQSSFIPSYYLQHVHEGGFRLFHDWLADLELSGLSWGPVIAAAEREFGQERVVVVDFRRIQEGQRAFLRAFFEAIDPTLDLDTDYRPLRNPSISAKGLQIALAANPFLSTREERQAFRKFLQSQFSNRDYPRPALLDPDTRARLDAQYGDEYEAIVEGGPARVVALYPTQAN